MAEEGPMQQVQQVAGTKIVLNRQSDLILDNANITAPVGIVVEDIEGLVDALSGIDTAIEDLTSNKLEALDNMEAFVIASHPKEMEEYVGDGVETMFASNVLYGTHILFLNGLRQREGSDYTHSDGVYTFAEAPAEGNIVSFYGVDGTVELTQIEAPEGGDGDGEEGKQLHEG
jgi:hypothetical protein